MSGGAMEWAWEPLKGRLSPTEAFEAGWKACESQALAALREIEAVLGPGPIECDENGCEGCKAEMDIALAAARQALALPEDGNDG